jgi:hypothetical protein
VSHNAILNIGHRIRNLYAQAHPSLPDVSALRAAAVDLDHHVTDLERNIVRHVVGPDGATIEKTAAPAAALEQAAATVMTAPGQAPSA